MRRPAHAHAAPDRGADGRSDSRTGTRPVAVGIAADRSAAGGAERTTAAVELARRIGFAQTHLAMCLRAPVEAGAL